jgi:uncharacterized protein (DUF924 family)
MADPEEILHFWFADSLTERGSLSYHVERWFDGGAVLDEVIAARFGRDIEAAHGGGLNGWRRTARGRLALIILLDQFTRNAFRGSADAYRSDPAAAALCREGIERQDDRSLSPIERGFFYMPLLHSERLEDQRLGIISFERLLAQSPPAMASHFRALAATAHRHHAVIRTFGRFPHRNRLLGRRMTSQERVYLGLLAVRRRAREGLTRLCYLAQAGTAPARNRMTIEPFC